MSKKSSIGFATQKQAREAIRAIVHQYGLEQEFFHPLLQRLFIEQPYWQEPPGPTFTKFKWSKQTLPSGATTEKWFWCYDAELGMWIDRSWNRAIRREQPDPVRDLRVYARELVAPIVNAYRDAHPFCEHCKDGFPERTAHVHHTIAMKTITDGALALLTAADFAALTKLPIPVTSGCQKFAQYILDAHCLDILVALCVRHHNDAHGKETHT